MLIARSSLLLLLGGLDDSDHWIKYVGFVSFDDVAAHNHLVDYKMGFLYVKHYLPAKKMRVNMDLLSLYATYIQFANILKVFVQGFHHIVDEL